MAKITTQDFLEFDQIRDGILLLKNKTQRAILMVSPSNFALKSDDEQNAIIYQFQSFLNSLDFSCQILIHSRRLNIAGYLDKLKEIEEKEIDELMKIQVSEYRKFIEGLMGGGAIMQKIFYVVIPFSLLEAQRTVPEKRGVKIPKISILTEEDFQRCKAQLLQRVEFVALGLRRGGLQVIPLTTLELVELFWSLHHPLEAERGYFPEIPPELVS
jgi:hypothetical protein